MIFRLRIDIEKYLQLGVLILLCLIFSLDSSKAQVSVTSTNGYTVHIDISPQSIVAPSSCPFGYNYNVNLNYTVTFSGTNVPASLYTLQGSLTCSSQGNFFNLPNSGGSGSVTSGSNPYLGTSDCATATPSSLGCNSGQIQIEGPGIPNQFVSFSASTLPIELTYFTSEKTSNGVLLEWETASEVNNHFFTIEKSNDGANYEAIGNIEGNGTTNKTSKYQYLDREVVGNAYYRLKQTDFDGVFKYEGLLFEEYLEQQNNGITFYPNPNNTNSIRWTGGSEHIGFLEIYSQEGKLISSTFLNRMEELYMVLSPGLYFLHFTESKSGNRTISKYIQL